MGRQWVNGGGYYSFPALINQTVSRESAAAVDGMPRLTKSVVL